MLASLSIRDFVIVDTLQIEFERGFSTLTGETGAGKSILIDALALALGDRADSEVVRPGAERAEIQAEFDIRKVKGLARWLEEQALEGDPGVLLLRRVVEREGRSRAFVNGRGATLAQLREAGEWLVDIHGQHAHQSLLKSDAQRKVLDSQAGLDGAASEVAQAYRRWHAAQRVRIEASTQAAAREAEREQLAWQAEELSRLGTTAGEWQTISGEHSRLAHAASLIAGVESAIEAVAEGDEAVATRVASLAAKLRGLLAYDAALAPVIEILESAHLQLDEAGHELRRYRDRADLDPSRLAEVESRLEALHATARKFRLKPEELVDRHASVRERLAELERTSDLAKLEAEEATMRAQYDVLASALTRSRKKAATKLAKEVSAAMKDLALGVARFDIALELIEGGSSAGNERVEFLVATNPGVEPRALARVASGGELSRISLAIQVITSKAAAVPTLIFDEVDAGIGGAVAEIVGRKLAELGASRQVLCVTHLPQVAAQAGAQWSVAKVESRGKVSSRVTALDERSRVEEIARMLGGTEITATTRKHAAEMLGARSK
jgi:DNA repair protein RecN (Recombination protein N)